jgi:hypothetical protein
MGLEQTMARFGERVYLSAVQAGFMGAMAVQRAVSAARSPQEYDDELAAARVSRSGPIYFYNAETDQRPARSYLVDEEQAPLGTLIEELHKRRENREIQAQALRGETADNVVDPVVADAVIEHRQALSGHILQSHD